MNLRRIFGLSFVAMSLLCSAQQINPLVKALLDSYQEILKENPKDYVTLYERAAQYFRLSDYQNALTDISNALRYTPEKESQLRAQEFSLLADIDIEMKDYEGALRAVNNALELDATSYADIYKKGNICLYMENPEEAYKAFSSMQRLKARSQEAYFGMAKACVMMGREQEATNLIKEAENADPNNYITFCRIGDLYRDMSQPENAATNYLSAISLSDGSLRPLESLIDLAKDNYPAVKTAMDYTINLSENKLPLNFLLGNIAYNSGNYSEASAPLEYVLSTEEGKNTEGVYETIIRNLLAQNKTDEAEAYLVQMNSCFSDAKTALMRAMIDFASGNYSAASIAAAKALKEDPNVADGMKLAIYSDVMAGNYKDALEKLNETIMANPENIEMLLLRNYVNGNISGYEKNASADLQRAASTIADGYDNAAFRAIAKAHSGKVLDAQGIVETELIAKNDKDAAYWAAVYYAQTDDAKKANEMINRAKQLGYQNEYNLSVNTMPMVSIAPARNK
ncbi:MAG: tetratricopeptide repeat protein [Bacteroidales bacterium]|nr:tetratricopeptide repeat protein [Bacteroidales bacterium]